MDDELTPEQKFAAEDAQTIVLRGMKLGQCHDDILADLVRLDWSPMAAEALIARVTEDLRKLNASYESREQLRAEAGRQFVAGVALALLGIFITVFSLLASLAGAFPFFVLSFGLFFGGTSLAGRGWARLRLCRQGASPPEEPR